MSTWLEKLKRRFPSGQFTTERSILDAHSGDAWWAQAQPEAVFFPESTADLSRLMKVANQEGVPVTARGAGKGYVGGCVPQKGGIVVSFVRMNRILEITPVDGVARVQPGVITADLQDAVAKLGWFYPPDPASR